MTEAINVEDFFLMKFPQKLWKIVNDCNTGAIQWSTYGKTILIDYKLFQAQYLECETPKFKTRNMTSFVRQLNMYGFKKFQTQIKNENYRCCNIHEFYHSCFRFGRHDLLENVKRRSTAMKNTKSKNSSSYQNQSRVQMCRNSLSKALMNSQIQSSSKSNINEAMEKSGFEVIPVHNSLSPYDCKGLLGQKYITVEISSKYSDYIEMDAEATSEESDEIEEIIETDQEGVPRMEITAINSEMQPLDGSTNVLYQECLEQASVTDNYLLDISLNKFYNTVGNQTVQVKKGFDGNNYVIDLTEEYTGEVDKGDSSIEQAYFYQAEECEQGYDRTFEEDHEEVFYDRGQVQEMNFILPYDCMAEDNRTTTTVDKENIYGEKVNVENVEQASTQCSSIIMDAISNSCLDF